MSYFNIRRDVVSVLSSNHFSSQQLTNHPTNRLLLYQNMPMMNSRTFQSPSGLNTITRPSPRRSGGDYPLGQQVCCNKSGLLLMKTDLCRLRSMTCLHRPPPDPGVQDLGDGRLSLGASPFQSQRIGAIEGTGTDRSSSEVPLEDY